MEYLQFNPSMLTGAFLLFMLVAIGMLLAPLLIGLLLRPNKPGDEKLAIYECGEPTIGSSNVQFDLRFYVVALLFIVFDVEVAFFFPWAVVFGKATTLSSTQLNEEQRIQVSSALLGELVTKEQALTEEAAGALARIALLDLLVFFGVVLVGFAYIWKRGDLDWVRSVARQRAAEQQLGAQPPPAEHEAKPALTM